MRHTLHHSLHHTLRLLTLGVALFFALPTQTTVAAPPPIAGINGAVCDYLTIKDAIAAAEKGDTILIEPGTYTELLGEIGISLTFVPAKAGAKCASEDTAATSASVIIDGGGGSDDATGGLAEINRGAEVRFRHMWLRNATATNGGVIAVTGSSTLILDDANVTDGTVSSSGGNIYAFSSSGNLSQVHLENGSNVYRGTATFGDGGAIALFRSTLTVQSGGIGVSSNNGFSTAGNNGGGIYATDSTINLNSSSANVIWNQAGASGGGIYALNTTINITNARIENNQAATSGGGIYLQRISGGNAQLTANGGTISFNETTASSSNEGGGGLYLEGFFDVVMADVALNDNSSDNLGGAIAARSAVQLTLTDTTVEDNSADGPGGAFYLSQSATNLHLDNTVVQNNTTSSLGGGIYSAFASISLRNNAQVIFNVAAAGGGIYVTGTTSAGNNTSLHAQDSYIAGNQAVGSSSPTVGNGGGLHGFDLRIVMTDTVFSLNEAKLSGGAIYLTDVDSELRAKDSSFSANRTVNSGANQGGGAIYAEGGPHIWFEDVIVEGNESDNSGGGFMLRSNADLNMWGEESWIGYNTSNASGGGIFAAQSSTRVVMTDTLISNNFANSIGGGVQFTFAGGTFTNVEVRDNEADEGAGMHLWFSESAFSNARFLDNTATEYGGGLYLNGSAVSFTSVFGPDCMPFGLPANAYCAEFDGNSALEQGGALFITGSISPAYDGYVKLEHSVLRGNLAPIDGTAIFIDGTYTPTVVLQNVLVNGNGANDADSTTIKHDGAGALGLNHVTVAGNFDEPLVMLTAGSALSLTSSILYENLVGPRVVSSVSRVTSCNIAQNASSNGVPLGDNVNPVFVTTARGHYRLGEGSPAVDECLTGTPLDTDLGFRPVGQSFDMGAFERGASTTTFLLTVGEATGNGSGQVTSTPEGISCPTDCTESYPNNAIVAVVATPAANSTFGGWTGPCPDPASTTCTLTMSTNRTVTPNFVLREHELTVTTSGNGTMTSNPAGITCGGDCSETYVHDTLVTLTPTAGEGATFTGWSGACSGDGACVVTMNAAKSVGAFFGDISIDHTLLVTTTGDGSGTVHSIPAGIVCGAADTDCDSSYSENTPVELTPEVEAGSEFAGWSGDCTGSGPCQLAMDADKVVTASFDLSALSYTLTVTNTGDGIGVVSSTPAGILCGDSNDDCDEGYTINTLVDLTATHGSGVRFMGWSGDCSGTGPCPVTMDMTRTVTATFALITHTLTVTNTGSGSGVVTSDPAGITCDSAPGGSQACAATYVDATAVALSAQPAPGSTFTGWTDDCSGSAGCNVVLDTDRTVGAIFATSDISHTLTVTLTGTGQGSIVGSAEDSAAEITCSSVAVEGNVCAADYIVNTQVTLIANPGTGSLFTGWSGACSGTDICLVDVDETKLVTADFAIEQVDHDLTVAIVGAGSVTSTVAGITCPADCTQSYAAGTVVSLTAGAEVGANFVGWSGACTGSETCAVEMATPRVVTATFGAAQVGLSVALAGEGEGTVTSAPAGIDCGITCHSTFVYNATVTLTATPAPESSFAGWSGACTGKEECVVTLDGAKSVTARMNLIGDEPTIHLPFILHEPQE